MPSTPEPDPTGFELSFDPVDLEEREISAMEDFELLDEGMDGPASEMTGLYQAAEFGNLDEVKRLIGLGVDVNQASGPQCKGVLHATMISAFCWDERRWECFMLLLKAGADIDAVDIYGNTPSIDAAIFGLDKQLDELIKRGADIRVADMDGIAPLEHALKAKSDGCVEILRSELARLESLELAAGLAEAKSAPSRTRL